MNLVILIGSGAVGKMTVGQELMKITDYRLFHNHMMIEPVIDIFGKFEGSAVSKLRDVIFEEFMKSSFDGMIFTYMWAFDMQSDWDYIRHVSEQFEASGGTVFYVELVADRAVRIERNKTENRLFNKASKRDLALSEGRMLREETKYRLVSNEGEIPFENYMKIDNTNLEPGTVAQMIKEHFNLPDKSKTELSINVKIEEAREDELGEMLKLQKESFLPLYEKYHDEGSPALETVERLKARINAERKYFFIVYYGMRVGGMCLGRKAGSEGCESPMYISPIFITPAFQDKGIGEVAMNKAFDMFPDEKVWKLDTLLQEPRDIHFYEKLGFKRIGDPKPVNEYLSLLDYERRIV